MSKDYLMGVGLGIILVGILAFGIWKVNGSVSMKGEYDERQELIRGRGYKYAFFVVIGLLAVYMFAEAGFENFPAPGSVIAFAILMVGVIVYALYCIHNGAFFGVNNNYKTYRIILIIVVLTNVLAAIGHLRDGSFIEDGKLTLGPSMQVIAVIGFAIVWIAMEIQLRRDRLEGTDEES